MTPAGEWLKYVPLKAGMKPSLAESSAVLAGQSRVQGHPSEEQLFFQVFFLSPVTSRKLEGFHVL